MRGLQERRSVAALSQVGRKTRQRPSAGAGQRQSAGAAPETAPRARPRARAKRLILLGAIAAVALGADQLTKSLAVHYLSHGPVPLLGPLSLSLTYNSGAAFSMGQGLAPLLVVVGVVLVAVLVGVGRTVADTPSALAIGLVLGGALGNLVDRLARADHGAVIDFVETRYWPTFNLADACIVCGAILLMVAGLRHRRPPSPPTDTPPDSASAPPSDPAPLSDPVVAPPGTTVGPPPESPR